MTHISCPRCSKPCTTRVRGLTTGLAGGTGIGLLYVLMLPFCKHTYCPEHGKIPLTEFSEAERKRMSQRTAIQLTAVVVLLVAAIFLMMLVLQED